MSAISFWDKRRMVRKSTLSVQEKLLLVWLADYSETNDIAFPSEKTLSRDMSLSVRQVRTIIRKLEDAGVLKVTRGKPNRYQILWDAIPQKRKSTSALDNTRNRKPTSGIKPPNRKPTSDSNRKPASAKHRKERNGLNGHGHGALKTWRIEPDEFDNPAAIDARFQEAVERGLCHSNDRLRFHTSCIQIYLQYLAKKIKNPGAILRHRLQARMWDGTNSDEDEARRRIRELDENNKKPVNRDVAEIAKGMAVTTPEGIDDDPVC